MKKLIFTLLFFSIITIYNVKAQSPWWNSTGTKTYNQPLTNTVGIGTNAPSATLEVKGTSVPNFKVSSSTSTLEIGIATCAGCYSAFANSSSVVIRPLGWNGTDPKNIIFTTATTANSGSYLLFGSDSDILMKINDNKTIAMGNVTTPAGYFLYVEKGILTEKVKIAVKSDAVNWSDFVFAKDYKLMPLNEVEKFVVKNKHLPEIPSAKEVYKEGIDVAQMDAKLLQKIEELTLYMIDLKKENQSLKSRIDKIEKK